MSNVNGVPCEVTLWGSHTPSTSAAPPPPAHPSTSCNDDAEQQSWQLSSFASFSTPDTASKPESDDSKLGIQLRRRGRPLYTTPSPPVKEMAPPVVKPKFIRRTKSRKKRLTITKGMNASGFARRMLSKAAQPVIASNPSIPVAALTDSERSIRMEKLLQACPEELADGLRKAHCAVEKMKADADIFREVVRGRIRTGEAVEDLSSQMLQEAKQRQEKLDDHDIQLTSALCETFSDVHMDRKGEEGCGPWMPTYNIFSSGLSDIKVNMLRGLLGLPELRPSLTANGAYSQPAISSNGTHVPVKEETKPAVETNGVANSTRQVCDFTNRIHPRELSQQLYAVLGKNAQPKAEKRANLRTKRASQMDNLTEERINGAISGYMQMCDNRVPDDYSVKPVPYLHMDKNNFSDVDRHAESVQEAMLNFQGNFVKPCLCKGVNKCDMCRDLPREKRCLPIVSNVTVPQHALVYSFCELCSASYPHEIRPTSLVHPNHSTAAGPALTLDSIKIYEECCSVEEEQAIVRMLNKRSWMTGQTGCFRQDYGPLVDYARQEVGLEPTSGLPQFIEYEVLKIRRRNRSKEASSTPEPPFECQSITALELTPDRASAVQPRVENQWIWGNDVIFMALSADVILTLSPVAWDGAETYRIVRIRVPRRSQVVIGGHVRCHWNYSVVASDVHEKQILLIFRELSQPFLVGDGAEIGRQIQTANAAFKGDVNSGDGE